MDISEFYNTNVQQYRHRTQKLQDTEWLERFKSMLPEGGSVLDVGCAYGRDLVTLAKDFSVTGIDVSEMMLEEARELVPQATLIHGDILDAELGAFDGIWASALFVHIPRKKAFKLLKKFASLLKPDGVLFVSTKEGETDGMEYDPRYGVEKFHAYYSKEELEQLLRKSGFTVLESTSVPPTHEYHTHALIRILARKS